MNIQILRIVQYAKFFQQFSRNPACDSSPFLRRSFNQKVDLYSGSQFIEFFSQNDVLLSLIGKQKLKLNLLVDHRCNLFECLITRRYSTSASHKKYLFELVKISIWLMTKRYLAMFYRLPNTKIVKMDLQYPTLTQHKLLFPNNRSFARLKEILHKADKL
jgi:hypothetical protein